jgi:tRNA pseudouridine55 synthase
MNGVLNIDKPAGMTSHDVVGRIRKIARQKRVGHSGTLDPDATGVLVVCLGTATRIADLLADAGKRYRCTLVLGAETDTEDASGTVTAEVEASGIAEADLRAVLPLLTGEIMQVPPMVSAVHHEGKRLYELARAGITVERAARPVTIESLRLTGFTPGSRPTAVLDVECGKGTYIRTLCADIGRALGVGGHMGSLRRTRVGRFTDADAVPLAELDEQALPASLVAAVDALDLPRAMLADAALIDDIRHGRSVDAAGAPDDAIVQIVDAAGGDLLALARSSGGRLRPYKVFTG